MKGNICAISAKCLVQVQFPESAVFLVPIRNAQRVHQALPLTLLVDAGEPVLHHLAATLPAWTIDTFKEGVQGLRLPSRGSVEPGPGREKHGMGFSS
jgi:hypothetical protein